MRTLSIFIALTGIHVILWVPSSAAQEPVADLARERAGRLLEAHLDVLDVPGMQVAVARGGRLTWSRGFGLADVEDGTPVTPLTRFPIASLSKCLTAVAAATLAEGGRLDWNASVQTYVPSFPRKRWPIAVRQLAGHLAGIRHYRDGELETAGSRHYADVRDALTLFAEDSLLFRPGTEFRYSSYGYNLLSAVVQGAADRPFLDYVEQRVLVPAGMGSTSAAFPDSLISHRAETYVEGEAGERLRAPSADPSYKWGSGGYLSTAEDLVRFGQALLDARLVTRETVQLLWEPMSTLDGESTDYGIGFELLETRDGRKVAYHGGNLAYARAHLMIVPSAELVVAVLANTGQGIGFNDEEMLALTELFVEEGEISTFDPSGRYLFRSTWQGEPATGYVEIRRAGDDYVGTLSFPARSHPVPVVDVRGRTAHLIAVPGSWLHLWLDFGADEIRGRWAWGPFEESIAEVRRLGEP